MLQEQVKRMLADLFKDTFDPASFLKFIQSCGIDPSRLSEFVGQSGFDYYSLLGLDKTASEEEIKKRYQKMAHKLHPDTAGVEGTEYIFKLVKAAYEMIKKERGWQ